MLDVRWQSDISGTRPMRVVASTMREIVADVAERHGLTSEDLRSPNRTPRISHPRQEAMWLMRQVRLADGSHRYSLPQIAAFLNMKDHTTILHGVRAYEARREAAISQEWAA